MNRMYVGEVSMTLPVIQVSRNRNEERIRRLLLHCVHRNDTFKAGGWQLMAGGYNEWIDMIYK